MGKNDKKAGKASKDEKKKKSGTATSSTCGSGSSCVGYLCRWGSVG